MGSFLFLGSGGRPGPLLLGAVDATDAAVVVVALDLFVFFLGVDVAAVEVFLWTERVVVDDRACIITNSYDICLIVIPMVCV